MKKLLCIFLLIPFTFLGQDNYSLSFDGVDDFVSFDGLQTNVFTLSAWVNPDSETETDYFNILSNDDPENKLQWGFHDDNLVLSFHVAGFSSGIYSNIVLERYNWNFVTVVYDGEALSFYLNSNLDISVPVSNLNTTSPFSLIGRQYSTDISGSSLGSIEPLNGKISELQIWDKSLTSEEIHEYMSCSPPENIAGMEIMAS